MVGTRVALFMYVTMLFSCGLVDRFGAAAD